MNTRKYITLAAVFALTILSAGKVNAHGSYHPSPPPPPPPPVCPPSKNLPIDGNIVLLMVAGIVIGITTVKKTNSAIKAV
jgi:hypothetical protein